MNGQTSYQVGEMLQNLQVHVTDAHYTQCWPQWRELDYTPAHNKFYLIEDGEGWIQVDSRTFHPAPGQMCLLPARVRQSYSAIDGKLPFRKYWCHFTARLGDLDLFQWLDVPYCQQIRDVGRMTELFRELTAWFADPSLTARFREKAVLLEILSLYLENAPVRIAADRSGDLERLTEIERFIETKLAEPLSLDMIARHLHLHPNYLVRYFQKHFAVSPLKYLTRKRMDKAKQLLQTTPLSVKEVAEQVGYGDTNHFSKAFRRETSLSPTEYRRHRTPQPQRSENNKEFVEDIR